MPDYINRETAMTIVDRLRDKCGNDEMAFALNWASRLIREIPAADVVERPSWIPVTERLPDYLGRFMCYYEVNDRGEIGHCIDWGRYDPNDGWYVSGVTHWMPLPEPPEEET